MMKWATIVVALAGLTLGIYTVSTASSQAPVVPLAAEPSINPFNPGIAATGTVEAASRNVAVVAPEGGVVTRVLVQVGDRVKAGDPLFEIDARVLQADRLRALAAVEIARAQVERLSALPRPESLPPLESTVRFYEATLEDFEDQHAVWTQARGASGATDQEVRRRWFAMEAARHQLERSRSELALTKAGAWSAELDVARAELAGAQAELAAVDLLIERRTVRAPLDATVLKRDVEPGEWAGADTRSPAMTLGDLSTLHIRARVDEEDLPSLRAGARGLARVRGAATQTAELAMVRIEPLAQPKTDLSGSTVERVDTRVLEVVFEVTATSAATLYPGQLVDVFIDASAP